ncbi:MAG TPA: hypothetical protein VFZ53_01015 [Polyangiaceae bacterium]
MISFARTLSVFAVVAFGLLPLAGCDDINEALDCDQMCEKMQSCVDDDIDVHDCAERCEDRVEDNELAEKLDACTDCLDEGVSCREVAADCSVCDEVQMALLP